MTLSPIRERWVVGLYLVYVSTFFVSQAIMSIGLAFFLAALIVARPSLHEMRSVLEKGSRSRSYLFWTTMLTASVILSLIGATIFPLSIGEVTTKVEWPFDLWRMWYFYLPIAHFWIMKRLSAEANARLVRGWMVLGLIAAVFAIPEVLMGWNYRQRHFPIQFAPFSGMAQFVMGTYLPFAAILSFVFAFWGVELFRSKYWPGKKALVVFATLVGITVLVGTKSRAAWIAVPVCIGLAILMLGSKKQIGVSLVLLLVGLGALTQHPAIRERLTTSFGISERYSVWKAHWGLFLERPVTGVGFRKNSPLVGPYYEVKAPEIQPRFVGHAHNNALEVLTALGIVGFFAWIIWNFWIFRHAGSAGPALFIGWAAFHVHGLTQVNFWESKCLHSSMWTVGLILYALESHHRSKLLGGKKA